MQRARAVGLVREDGVPKGTGFLIGGGLLLTCFHVLPDRQRAASYSVEFNYWQNAQGEAPDATLYRLDADSFWLSSRWRRWIALWWRWANNARAGRIWPNWG
ncbi:hypothetical protein HA44_19220 [Mixta gaviniae]|nr:hypothetical protein HA44_19220 [Mixta gaviniae]